MPRGAQGLCGGARGGERAVALRPDWPKAHSRAGAAHHGLGDLEAAAAAYRAAAAAGDAASKDVALIEGLLRNQQLEALIERGAFNKRDDDDSGGGARRRRRGRKSARRRPRRWPTRARKAWMDAAKAGDVDGLAQCLAAEPWLLSNRSENTSEKQLGNSALHWAAARGKPAARCDDPRPRRCQRQPPERGGRDGAPLGGGARALEGGGAAARRRRRRVDQGRDQRDRARRRSRRGYKIVEAAIDRGAMGAVALDCRGGAAADGRRGEGGGQRGVRHVRPPTARPRPWALHRQR